MTIYENEPDSYRYLVTYYYRGHVEKNDKKQLAESIARELTDRHGKQPENTVVRVTGSLNFKFWF